MLAFSQRRSSVKDTFLVFFQHVSFFLGTLQPGSSAPMSRSSWRHESQREWISWFGGRRKKKRGGLCLKTRSSDYRLNGTTFESLVDAQGNRAPLEEQGQTRDTPCPQQLQIPRLWGTVHSKKGLACWGLLFLHTESLMATVLTSSSSVPLESSLIIPGPISC